MDSEEFVPLTPVNFFQISAECRYLSMKGGEGFPYFNRKNAGKYLLPDTSALCGEKAFAEVALSWSQEGVEAYVKVNRPFQRASYPDIDRGDSVELFIDTRDIKNSGFNTRFCHHFYFLAEGIEGNMAGEMTRFRTEDAHPLCNPNELKVKALLQSDHYILHVFIPSQCLYGYDPEQFKRLGFSYRINRAGGHPQHFSVVSEDFALEQQPSLWGSLKLVS